MAWYSSCDASFAAFVRTPWVYITAVCLSLFSLMIMLCFNLTREVPANYLFLALFTLGESLIVAYATSYYTPETVIVAIILFAITTFCLWGASLCMRSID